MKQNITNNNNAACKLVSQLAAEKKKTFIALGLIAVMVFMWVRVLGKKTAASAQASANLSEAAAEQANTEPKISFIELPKVKGRNDTLSRDFFAANNWQGFSGNSGNLTSVEEVGTSKNGSEGIIRRIAEKLNLEAILSGENPQAFINDKLLSVGGKLFVKDGKNKYECEVVGIEQTRVFIRCGKAKITLKLKESTI